RRLGHDGGGAGLRPGRRDRTGALGYPHVLGGGAQSRPAAAHRSPAHVGAAGPVRGDDRGRAARDALRGCHGAGTAHAAALHRRSHVPAGAARAARGDHAMKNTGDRPGQGALRKWLPSPPLTLALFILWPLLNGSLSPGHLLLGAVLAVIGPLAAA